MLLLSIKSFSTSVDPCEALASITMLMMLMMMTMMIIMTRKVPRVRKQRPTFSAPGWGGAVLGLVWNAGKAMQRLKAELMGGF